MTEQGGINKVKENSRFNKIFIRRILVILVFILTLLVMRGNETMLFTYSEGVSKLDMRFRYNANDVYQLFEILGIAGRSLYIKFLCIDFIFITSFAVVQNYLLKWAMGKAMLNSRWRFLLHLSYFRALFDVMENISILILLTKFPTELPWLVIVSSFATSLKLILLYSWFIAIPVSFFVRKKIKNLKRSEML